MKITKHKIVANKKSVKAATSGKIPYDLVSMLVILRDWANTDDSYINKEHEDLVGIADFLYIPLPLIHSYGDFFFKILIYIRHKILQRKIVKLNLDPADTKSSCDR